MESGLIKAIRVTMSDSGYFFEFPLNDNPLYEPTRTTPPLYPRRFGEKEIDHAVDGFRWIRNHSYGIGDILKLVDEVRAEGIEFRLEPKAYYLDKAEVVPGLSALYIRGPGIKPRPPEFLVEEATNYLRLESEKDQRDFLSNVYAQMFGKADGEYGARYRRNDPTMYPTLYYWADKLRGLGNNRPAKTLEQAANDLAKMIELKQKQTRKFRLELSL